MLSLPVPDSVAASILALVRAEGAPTDLGAVASLWPGLRLAEEELDRPGYLIDLGEIGGEIIVRRADSFPRKRFTTAHELGHWVLSREYRLSEDAVNTRQDQIDCEKWCDAFAASLLMPRSWVRGDLRAAGRRGLLRTIGQLPRIYQVSHRTFRVRVSEVTPVTLYEIEACGGHPKVAHSYVSREVDARLLSPTLRERLHSMGDGVVDGQQIHRETGMVSLCKPISQSNGVPLWLVALMPLARREE